MTRLALLSTDYVWIQIVVPRVWAVDGVVSSLLPESSHQVKESSLRALLEAADIFLCQNLSVEEATYELSLGCGF